MMEQSQDYPILYSFRRCPYAMRARLALRISEQKCELREIVLRDKPAEMLAISAKGTVPVLLLPDGTVLGESLDIMKWALAQNDPQSWLADNKDIQALTVSLITQNDQLFKYHLDRYKYPERYQGEDALEHRALALQILQHLDEILSKKAFLTSNMASLADFALFPFIRQFANTDRAWFDAEPLEHLQRWLDHHLSSDLFISIMTKIKPWNETGKKSGEIIWFPFESLSA